MRSAFPPGHVWIFSLLNIKDQAPCLPPHVCGSLSVPGFCLLHAGLLVRETGRWGFLCGSSTCLLNSDFYINVTTPPLHFIPWFVFVISILSRLPEFQNISCWCRCFLVINCEAYISASLHTLVSGFSVFTLPPVLVCVWPVFLELSLEGLCWLAAHWRLFSWL